MLLPITVLLAIKNEEKNLDRCLQSLERFERVIAIDSNSTDDSLKICNKYQVEVVQFTHAGGYPKKRQWALDNVPISTPWILLLDADEVVPESLASEISREIQSPNAPNGFLIKKEFHFLGQKFKYGGFSHEAILLIRRGMARFEELVTVPGDSLDMEVHERVNVDGAIKKLKTPVIHEDFKGLAAYLQKHNAYSTWEAFLRIEYLLKGRYGRNTIQARPFGNSQERRRWLKLIAIQTPFEPVLWFLYHYLFRMGFLEGRPGLIACQIRSQYISNVRAKMYELKKRHAMQRHSYLGG